MTTNYAIDGENLTYKGELIGTVEGNTVTTPHPLASRAKGYIRQILPNADFAVAGEPVKTGAAATVLSEPLPNDPPPLDPRFGDKTPAYVEWLKATDEEAYSRAYAGRKTHLS